MTRLGHGPLATLLMLLMSGDVTALERPETPDPKLNYVLFCAGCHGLDGQGARGRVPALRQSLALLLPHPAGRAFVTRVPGVANSALSDEGLAGVLNWCAQAFADTGVGSAVFTAREIHAARAEPLLSVVASRRAVFEAVGASAVADQY